MNWSYSLNPLYPSFFWISRSFSKYRRSIVRNKKGYDPPLVRAKENLKLSHDGLILRKSKILACTVDFVNVVCDYQPF